MLADEPTGNLDSAATLEVLRLFDDLHEAGQTLVVVTHDSRIAATADRLISMRDGAFLDETRLTGGTTGSLAGNVVNNGSVIFYVDGVADTPISYNPGYTFTPPSVSLPCANPR